MTRCTICSGYGLVKREETEPKCKKVSKVDRYSSYSQYGLYKECEKCMGTGKIGK